MPLLINLIGKTIFSPPLGNGQSDSLPVSTANDIPVSMTCMSRFKYELELVRSYTYAVFASDIALGASWKCDFSTTAQRLSIRLTFGLQQLIPVFTPSAGRRVTS